MKILIQILSRVFISSFFVTSALSKIFNWAIEEKQLFDALTQWEEVFTPGSFAHTVIVELIQAPTLLIGLSFGIYLVLGVLFLVGIRKGFAAGVLVISLVLSALLYHPFWLFEGTKMDEELLSFMLLMAVVGGLLVHAGGTRRYDADDSSMKIRFRDDD